MRINDPIFGALTKVLSATTIDNLVDEKTVTHLLDGDWDHGVVHYENPIESNAEYVHRRMVEKSFPQGCIPQVVLGMCVFLVKPKATVAKKYNQAVVALDALNPNDYVMEFRFDRIRAGWEGESVIRFRAMARTYDVNKNLRKVTKPREVFSCHLSIPDIDHWNAGDAALFAEELEELVYCNNANTNEFPTVELDPSFTDKMATAFRRDPWKEEPQTVVVSTTLSVE